MRSDELFQMVKEANNSLMTELLRVLEASVSNDRQYEALRRLILDRFNSELRSLRSRIGGATDQEQRSFPDKQP